VEIESKHLKATLAIILKGGVLLSASYILFGLLLSAITGDISYTWGYQPLNHFIGYDIHLTPSLMILLGFYVLLATPILSIITSVIMYIIEGDVAFAIITVVALMIILVGCIIKTG